MSDIGVGVEISLPTSSHFHIVRETLTRIGMTGGSQDFPTLYQSCHILHKRGKYYIVHFKEMFILDGLESSFDEDDEVRRDTIVSLLLQWNLIDMVGEEELWEPDFKMIKVLKKKDSEGWSLVPKYTIRSRKKIESFDEKYHQPDSSPPKPGHDTWINKVTKAVTNKRG